MFWKIVSALLVLLCVAHEVQALTLGRRWGQVDQARRRQQERNEKAEAMLMKNLKMSLKMKMGQNLVKTMLKVKLEQEAMKMIGSLM